MTMPLAAHHRPIVHRKRRIGAGVARGGSTTAGSGSRSGACNSPSSFSRGRGQRAATASDLRPSWPTTTVQSQRATLATGTARERECPQHEVGSRRRFAEAAFAGQVHIAALVADMDADGDSGGSSGPRSCTIGGGCQTSRRHRRGVRSPPRLRRALSAAALARFATSLSPTSRRRSRRARRAGPRGRPGVRQ